MGSIAIAGSAVQIHIDGSATRDYIIGGETETSLGSQLSAQLAGNDPPIDVQALTVSTPNLADQLAAGNVTTFSFALDLTVVPSVDYASTDDLLSVVVHYVYVITGMFPTGYTAALTTPLTPADRQAQTANADPFGIGSFFSSLQTTGAILLVVAVVLVLVIAFAPNTKYVAAAAA